MRFLIAVMLAVGLCAQTPVVTPANPKAVAGGTVQLSSTGTVTWSMAVGAVGSVSAGGLYTAPATYSAKQVAAGCAAYPQSSIFNTRVDALPVHASSTTWISSIAAISSTLRLSLQPSFGLNQVNNATATGSVLNAYTPLNDGNYPLLPFPDLQVEGGYFTSGGSGLDRHISSGNKDSCEFSEIYNLYPPGLNSGCPLCTAQSSVKYDGNALVLPANGTTDAAGLPIQPLLLRLQDILGGEIKHAMRYTMSNGLLGAAFVWPATTNAAAWGAIPYGTILRLKASKDISGYSAIAQQILTAWKHYGMYAADGGNTIDVQTDTDLHMNPAVWKAIEEIRLTGPIISDFEFADQSTLKVSNSSAAVKYDNAYQVPDGFAVVIAEDTTSFIQTKAYIAVQGVTVGTPQSGMVFQAGATAVQLTSWVNGSANQSVTWAMSPTVGTLTSGGLYTPPATVASPTTTTFTGTSAADANAKTYIFVMVWPAGTIRVNVGDTTSDITDGGFTWFQDAPWSSPQSFAPFDSTSWPGGTSALFNDLRYANGDYTYRFNLANGNYKLSLQHGQPYAGGGVMPKNEFVNTYDAQGQIVYHELDLAGLEVNYNSTSTIDLPLWVQDGTAYFTVRHLADNYFTGPQRHCSVSGDTKSMCAPLLAAFSIAVDATAAHITIDGSTADITIGQTRQLYAVGWYMAAGATWAVTSGPGSISVGGLYTAPSTPPGSTTSVTVTATSTVDGAKTATLTFNFVFGTIVVSPSTATLVHGLTRTFTAAINGASYTNVTWSRSPSVGSINASTGLYTAPTSLTVDTAVTITATSLDDGTKSGSQAVTVSAVMPPIRVNCGDTTGFTDALGNVWATDYGYNVGAVGYHNAVTIANTTSDMQPLYQSQRYAYAGDTLTYTFTVPAGLYSVRLKFADYSYVDAGHYTMSFTLNGVVILTNWDPDVEAGAGQTAIDKVYTSGVAGTTFTLVGTSTLGAAFVNGIEVIEIGPIPTVSINSLVGISGNVKIN